MISGWRLRRRLRVRSLLWPSSFKEKKFLPRSRVKNNIVWSLCDREVVCSASDRHGSNFESYVWRAVSSKLSYHPREVLLAQFSLYVQRGGLKFHLFHLICLLGTICQALCSVCYFFGVFYDFRSGYFCLKSTSLT